MGLLLLQLILLGHAWGIRVVWVLIDVQGLRICLSLAFGALLLALHDCGGLQGWILIRVTLLDFLDAWGVSSDHVDTCVALVAISTHALDADCLT